RTSFRRLRRSTDRQTIKPLTQRDLRPGFVAGGSAAGFPSLEPSEKRCRRVASAGRKGDSESRTTARLTGDRDAPAVQLDERLHQGQTQAHALAAELE